MAAIDPARFQPVPIGVTRQGTWLTPAQTELALERIRSERLRSLDEPLGDGSSTARPRFPRCAAWTSSSR